MEPQQPAPRPRDLPNVKAMTSRTRADDVKGYNTPQIRLKRSGQFGTSSDIPSYATLPRNSSRRSKSLIPNSPQHNAARLFAKDPAPPPHYPKDSTPPPHYPKDIASPPHYPTTTTSSSSRTLPKPIRKVSSPAGVHRVLISPVTIAEKPHTVQISTTPRMRIQRISKEEQLAKQAERRRRKEEYFKTTPPNKLTITQKDLEVYVRFYEKKLAGIVKDMDSNIEIEKRKKDRLEARLKFLLDDNDSLAMQLAGIKKDLKKCQILTETPV